MEGIIRRDKSKNEIQSLSPKECYNMVKLRVNTYLNRRLTPQ